VGGGLICLAGEAVECHDGQDGRLLWAASPPADAIVIDLDIGAGRVVASTTRGDVVAYDPLTGAVVWSRNVGTPLLATTATGLRVYSCRGGPDPADRGQCVVLEESNGSVRWLLAVQGPASAPLVRDGRMIVVDARAIHVVDVATGRLIRRIEPPREGPFHEARLAYFGGVLYANFRGELFALRIL
jgi:outer membrane protein assembly factor BamB